MDSINSKPSDTYVYIDPRDGERCEIPNHSQRTIRKDCHNCGVQFNHIGWPQFPLTYCSLQCKLRANVGDYE